MHGIAFMLFTNITITETCLTFLEHTIRCRKSKAMRLISSKINVISFFVVIAAIASTNHKFVIMRLMSMKCVSAFCT